MDISVVVAVAVVAAAVVAVDDDVFGKIFGPHFWGYRRKLIPILLVGL